MKEAHLGGWSGVAIGNVKYFGGALACRAEKGAVAAKASALCGAGVADCRGDCAAEDCTFEEAAG